MPLNNSQYNEIMREYEQIRRLNKHKQLDNIKEVYLKIPKIRDVDKAIPEKAIEKYHLYKSQKNNDIINDMELEIDKLKHEKTKLLIDNGFDSTYMDEIYTCDMCKDTGVFDNKKCICFKKKIINMLYRDSNLKNIQDDNNFDNISYEYYDAQKNISQVDMTCKDYMSCIIDLCKQYVDEFEHKKDNLLFMGNTGVGKTFLSQSIAKALIDKFHFVVYIESTDLFDSIGKIKFDTSVDECSYIYECIKDCELLIIDDLGTELINNFVTSQLFYIINDRLIKGQATIISTNLSLSDLRDLYSERVSSRLNGNYTIIPLYGDDIRNKRQ